MPSAGDGPLLEAHAKGGDEDTFAALMQRHWPQVVAVVRRASGSAADAEDGAQAVFIALARRARGLAGRASLAGWLHLAALNVGRRLAAATRARRHRERLAAPERTAVSEPDRALALALDEALAALPERERLPVLLHHQEGRSHDEAAALLGWPVGTFAAHLSRGRARLRRRLRLDEMPLAALLTQAPAPVPAPAASVVLHAPSAGVVALATAAVPATAGDFAAGASVAAVLAAGALVALLAVPHARTALGWSAAAGPSTAPQTSPAGDERLVRAFLAATDPFRGRGGPRMEARVTSHDWPLARRFYWVQWGSIDDLKSTPLSTLVEVNTGVARAFAATQEEREGVIGAAAPGGPTVQAAAVAIARAVACVARAQGALRVEDVRALERDCQAEAHQGVDGDQHPAWKVEMCDASGSSYGMLLLGHDSASDMFALDPPAQASAGDPPRQTSTAPIIMHAVAEPSRREPAAQEPASPAARQ